MVGLTEDTAPITDACAYVIELYRELTEENGVLGVGAQNQAVNFILADPLLSRYAKQWGERRRLDEATTAPPQRLAYDETHRRVRGFLYGIGGADFRA
jgi:hypothetical protein